MNNIHSAMESLDCVSTSQMELEDKEASACDSVVKDEQDASKMNRMPQMLKIHCKIMDQNMKWNIVNLLPCPLLNRHLKKREKWKVRVYVQLEMAKTLRNYRPSIVLMNVR